MIADLTHRDKLCMHAGGAWYTLSAMRVVNQALGRVIRHKDDFGAIILADERFARGDMQKNISYWARQLMTVRSEFGDLGGDLKKFFRENERNAPARPKKKPQNGGNAVLGEVCMSALLESGQPYRCYAKSTQSLLCIAPVSLKRFSSPRGSLRTC